MRIERARENVFTVTATSQELLALVAADTASPIRSLFRGFEPGSRDLS